MRIHAEEKKTEDIERTSVLQQTAWWSEVKEKQGFCPQAIDFEVPFEDLYTDQSVRDKAHDDLLIVYQPAGNGLSTAYVPYGPTLQPDEEHQGEFLEELSESIRPYLHKDCVAIRYDLLWESPWAKDPDFYTRENIWEGPPDINKQELRLNFCTENWNLRKSRTNILPSDTIFISLDTSDHDILMQMKPKTRYNIRLSQRKGVEVKRHGIDKLPFWYELYKETCHRNRIFLHDLHGFETVLQTDADHTLSPAHTELLIAEHEGDPLAAMFLSIAGKRATYLYGASSSKKRNHMATYALQWEAIRLARMMGCSEYDLFGISPYPDPDHPMYGLYRFKKGFGGRVFHRMGCWDYPLHPDAYFASQAAELASTGYHL